MPTKTTARAAAAPAVGHDSRRALTETEILRVALEIIDEHGIDGLTMRQLSSRLGVALGATYHHVQNKHSLLVLVAQSLFARVELPDTIEGDWLPQTRAISLSVTDVFRDQSELAAYILRHFDDMAPSEIMLVMRSILTDAGFSEAAVEDALMTLFFYIAGTLVGGFTTMGKSKAQVRDLRLRFDRGLDIILRGIQVELD
jgi:AcrR family transcriptional regulator